jgi:hypothetical protein
LEKLLTSEIRKEASWLLQAVRFFVLNNFLQPEEEEVAAAAAGAGETTGGVIALAAAAGGVGEAAEGVVAAAATGGAGKAAVGVVKGGRVESMGGASGGGCGDGVEVGVSGGGTADDEEEAAAEPEAAAAGAVTRAHVIHAPVACAAIVRADGKLEVGEEAGGSGSAGAAGAGADRLIGVAQGCTAPAAVAVVEEVAATKKGYSLHGRKLVFPEECLVQPVNLQDLLKGGVEGGEDEDEDEDDECSGEGLEDEQLGAEAAEADGEEVQEDEGVQEDSEGGGEMDEHE